MTLKLIGIRDRGKKYVPTKIPAKDANTFNKTCPATILAKSLTAKLKGLEQYDITSTGTNKIATYQGMSFGRNMRKNPNPCFIMPTIVMDKNTIKANEKVTTIWLVVVKNPGTIPRKFPKNIKVKTLKI